MGRAPLKTIAASCLAALSVFAIAGPVAASGARPEAARPPAKPAAHAAAPFVMASPLAGSFDWGAPFAMLERFSIEVQRSSTGLLDGTLPASLMIAPRQLASFAENAGARSYAYVVGLTAKPACGAKAAQACPAKAKTSA
jgi:hypothetical protein